MQQESIDALGEAFDAYSIESQLHDVPPHEVYEVRVADQREAAVEASGERAADRGEVEGCASGEAASERRQRAVDGRRAVFKRNTGPTGSAGVEGRVTAFVGEHTSVPVPEVLAVGDDWYVADWCPGAPAPDEGQDAAGWARAAGRGLATLHAETSPHLDGFGEFGVGDGGGLALPGHDDWHAAAIEYVEGLRGVLDEYGHADLAAAALDFLHDHPDAFTSGTADRTADGDAAPGDPVCCHGWWTPEHVAVEDGAVACVVDFEHAIAAPAEYDYWRTVLPAFDGAAARDAFRAGYESVRPLPDGLKRRRPLYVLLCTLYYVESLYVQDQHGPAETEERAGDLREYVLETLDDLEN